MDPSFLRMMWGRGVPACGRSGFARFRLRVASLRMTWKERGDFEGVHMFFGWEV